MKTGKEKTNLAARESSEVETEDKKIHSTIGYYYSRLFIHKWKIEYWNNVILPVAVGWQTMQVYVEWVICLQVLTFCR